MSGMQLGRTSEVAEGLQLPVRRRKNASPTFDGVRLLRKGRGCNEKIVLEKSHWLPAARLAGPYREVKFGLIPPPAYGNVCANIKGWVLT